MKKLLPWLVVGLLIRLILIPITLHPDIRGYNFAAFLINNGHALNFYDYMLGLGPKDGLIKTYGYDLFIYPPLAYWYPAIFMKILSPFYPPGLFTTLISEMWQILQNSDYVKLLYLLKLPYLLPDMLIVWLIGYLFEGAKEKFIARIIWLFNPVVIYTTYMVSQFDVLLALSIVSSLVLFKKKQFYLAAAALALGASVKQSTFFLLPLLVLFMEGNWLKKIAVFLSGVATYFLILLPYIHSAGFRTYALFASQTSKIFYAKIYLSGGEFLPLFLPMLFLIYWFCWRFGRKFYLWQWFFWALLLFYGVIDFHPQWFTWVTPLLIIFVVRLSKKAWLPVIVLLMAYLGMILMFDPSLNTGLFAPLNPPWGREFSLIPFLTKLFPEIIMRSMIASLFAAAAFFVGFLAMNEND